MWIWWIWGALSITEPTEALPGEGSQPGRDPTDNEHLEHWLLNGWGAFMLSIICNVFSGHFMKS